MGLSPRRSRQNSVDGLSPRRSRQNSVDGLSPRRSRQNSVDGLSPRRSRQNSVDGLSPRRSRLSSIDDASPSQIDHGSCSTPSQNASRFQFFPLSHDECVSGSKPLALDASPPMQSSAQDAISERALLERTRASCRSLENVIKSYPLVYDATESASTPDKANASFHLRNAAEDTAELSYRLTAASGDNTFHGASARALETAFPSSASATPRMVVRHEVLASSRMPACDSDVPPSANGGVSRLAASSTDSTAASTAFSPSTLGYKDASTESRRMHSATAPAHGPESHVVLLQAPPEATTGSAKGVVIESRHQVGFQPASGLLQHNKLGSRSLLDGSASITSSGSLASPSSSSWLRADSSRGPSSSGWQRADSSRGHLAPASFASIGRTASARATSPLAEPIHASSHSVVVGQRCISSTSMAVLCPQYVNAGIDRSPSLPALPAGFPRQTSPNARCHVVSGPTIVAVRALPQGQLAPQHYDTSRSPARQRGGSRSPERGRLMPVSDLVEACRTILTNPRTSGSV